MIILMWMLRPWVVTLKGGWSWLRIVSNGTVALTVWLCYSSFSYFVYGTRRVLSVDF